METTSSFTDHQFLEPVAGYGAFTAEAGGLSYLWRGMGPELCRSTTISMFDCYTEQWTQKQTAGDPPPGLAGGGCAAVGDLVYVFGGYDGSIFYNDMYSLNTSSDSLEWNEVEAVNPCEGPICKAGCGLVAVNEQTLACFGGLGIVLTRSGTNYANECEWTNEFHFLDVQKGAWSSPDIKGDRPPPCAAFSFTKVDQHRAVLFGGKQPGKGRVSDLYLFNFSSMEVTKVEPVPGESWPVGRSFHAACCLNYREGNPKLLISGGLNNNDSVLGDMWILDVDSSTWTKVKLPESVKPRYWHSVTATWLGPGLTEVLMFGGCCEWPDNWESEEEFTPIADTTILRFELTTAAASLVDITHNNTRGSSQRLREKMVRIRRATHRSPASRELTHTTDSPSSLQDVTHELFRPRTPLQSTRLVRVHCGHRKNGLKNHGAVRITIESTI